MNSAPLQNEMLLVNGSPRRNGNCDTVAGIFRDHFTALGYTCTELQLSRLQFSGCIGCERCRKEQFCAGLDDQLTPYYPLIERASHLALLSPVHNYNITAWMKAFIDRLYCYYDFGGERPGPWSSRLANQGRKLLTCCVAEQLSEKDFGWAGEALRKPLEALGYRPVYTLNILGRFKRDGVSGDPALQEQIRQELQVFFR